MLKTISLYLIICLLTNIFLLTIVSVERVEAGFWNDNRDSIITVVKGIIILWIINLIRGYNDSGDNDLITSTIWRGLNFSGLR